MKGVYGVVALSALGAVFSDKSSLVCENAHIPLRTMWLDDESSVCVVPFCGGDSPIVSAEGADSCMPCDQSPWRAEFGDYHAKTDVCPSSLGQCTDGHCCPQKGADTWYHQNFGVDWNGMNTFPHVTITTYEGGTACGGTVHEADEYLKSVDGIDAIAAVPSQMYGSWIRNQKAGSQACYVNNNVCYKITTLEGLEFRLAIWGKCGGYTQCTGSPVQAEGPRSFFSDYSTDINEEPVGWYDANRCLHNAGVKIAAGTTPDCIAMTGGDGTNQDGKKCCPHFCQKHVDWCGSNDHPHFDVSENIYDKVCANNSGPCIIKKVEPFLCPWNPPKNPAFGEWSPKFPSAKVPGDAEVAPIHPGHTPPTCDDDKKPAGAGPSPTSAPTTTSTNAPSDKETDPADVGMPVCDDVIAADIPGMGETCAAPVCSALCSSLTKDCKDQECVDKLGQGIKDALCPNSVGGCECEFSIE